MPRPSPPPPPSLDAAAIFAEAVRLHAAGQTRQAESLCQTILAGDPRHAPSRHLLGIIALQAGDLPQAVEQMQHSVDLDPASPQYLINLGSALTELARFAEAEAVYGRALALQESPEAHLNRGNLLHRMGRLDESVAAFQAALALQPNLAAVHNSLGHVLQRLGRNVEAVAALDRALALAPHYVEAHNNRGNAKLALGAIAAAIDSYRAALAVRPGYVSALNNLGNALFVFGRYAESRAVYDQAFALDPQSAAINNGLGNVLQRLSLWDESIASYRRAIAAYPDFAEGWSNLATAYHGKMDYVDALDCFDRALALEPNRFEAHSNRGNTLVALGRFDDAIASYARALEIRPGAAEVIGNIGAALVEAGRIDDAVAMFDQALALDPRRAKVHFLHVQAKPAMPGDPRIAAMEALARDVDALPGDDQIDLHFALAKTYADTGAIDRAFPHLIAGNALKRRNIAYDEAHMLDHIDHIAGAFSAEAMAAWRGMGSDTRRPVFILGMPRSGSTLVEQILASLSGVVGGGELNSFPAAAVEMLNGQGRFDLMAIPEADRAARLSHLAARYLADLQAVDPQAQRIADKMPANFILAGLIHLALPNAAIIHTRRDSLDTCLSCFSTLFSSGLPFSYDLGEIGRYYRHYDALMRHWRAVLPPQAMLEVDYEMLVADFETQARRIVDHCGLPWTDACLAFHKTERRVRTASATQVRRPLYKNAIARWRSVDPALLKPLTDELGKL